MEDGQHAYYGNIHSYLHYRYLDTASTSMNECSFAEDLIARVKSHPLKLIVVAYNSATKQKAQFKLNDLLSLAKRTSAMKLRSKPQLTRLMQGN